MTAAQPSDSARDRAERMISSRLESRSGAGLGDIGPGVLRSDVVVRPLARDNQPSREVSAATRASLSGTTAVQAILAALTASAQRQATAT
ncbi:hypothetical protein DVA67_032405 [Solirubrobacter sp. CPCC 204708]|nr:hypothetical protein [Solirubrobacter deserti]